MPDRDTRDEGSCGIIESNAQHHEIYDIPLVSIPLTTHYPPHPPNAGRKKKRMNSTTYGDEVSDSRKCSETMIYPLRRDGSLGSHAR